MVTAIVSAFAILLLFPGDALAWGPATHLELGSTVLKGLAVLPPAVRALIARYPYDFLYGNISADIVVGKNMVEELKHCHNWTFGSRLLKTASSDSQRAFAYGYLCHLAADTVAHNHFIPEMMIRSFSSTIRKHTYWELRFDALADKSVWAIPKKIVREVHRDNDALLSLTLAGTGTPLSFRTNKTIFSSIMSIHRVEQWHHMLDMMSSSSKWTLHKEEKKKFYDLAIEAVADVLTNGNRARCTKKDPRGKHNLDLAKRERKKLKTMNRSGRDWSPAMERAVKEVSP
ncbi:MAG: zinc dependent phospholipase C family protein [Thermodesulfobacteriota bacterium]